MTKLTLILLLIFAANAFAQSNSQLGCYQAFAKSDEKKTANSDKEWDKILTDIISRSVSSCYLAGAAKMPECMTNFLPKIRKCEAIGGDAFKAFVNETREKAAKFAVVPQKPGAAPPLVEKTE